MSKYRLIFICIFFILKFFYPELSTIISSIFGDDYLHNDSLYSNSNLHPSEKSSMSFYNKIRRYTHWTLTEKYGNISYESFKKDWDPNINITNDIISRSKEETTEMYHKYKVFKGTVNWFLNRRNPE